MKTKIFLWDWKDNAPVSAMLQYAREINFKFDQEIDTESYDYAHIISDTTLTQDEVYDLWKHWNGDE